MPAVLPRVIGARTEYVPAIAYCFCGRAATHMHPQFFLFLPAAERNGCVRRSDDTRWPLARAIYIGLPRNCRPLPSCLIEMQLSMLIYTGRRSGARGKNRELGVRFSRIGTASLERETAHGARGEEKGLNALDAVAAGTATGIRCSLRRTLQLRFRRLRGCGNDGQDSSCSDAFEFREPRNVRG